ncbi:hypothetical protein GOV12_02950 [Candidatus Pacearchaeota archaeon]|nr:hypothetical protein [Candidatus Pacearchaeota archaeon]
MTSPQSPIDYRTTNFSREGNVIKPLLSNSHKRIWDLVNPFQDAREDSGHAETCTYFALQLLSHYQDAEPNIVIPTVICHDAAWDMDPQEFKEAVRTGEADSPSFRLRHQVRGVRRAAEVLDKLNYPKEYISEVLEIISDHDSRFYPPRTINEKIMRDSDFLFRVSKPVVDIYLKDKSAREVYDHIHDNLQTRDKFYLPEATKLSRLEFANTMYHLFPNEAISLLKQEYSKEIDTVVRTGMLKSFS